MAKVRVEECDQPVQSRRESRRFRLRLFFLFLLDTIRRCRCFDASSVPWRAGRLGVRVPVVVVVVVMLMRVVLRRFCKVEYTSQPSRRE